jgi:molybdopterin molybdotransferase
MTSVEEALERVGDAAAIGRPRVEAVSLADALGRVLLEDVVMDHDVPAFRRATMDGWAVRAPDARPGAALRVVGRVAAGEWPSRALAPGEAFRILTGAPVPEGADAVVPFEKADEDADRVRPRGPWSSGDNVVLPGTHARSGQVVLAAGTRVGPAEVGALATAGAATVRVAARPRVVVLATGSEVVPVATRPGAAQIRNSNAPMLAAQARRAGAEPVELPPALDDEPTLRAALRRGLDADVLVVSGGVSRGDLDLVPGTLEALGVRASFHRWAVQPGGPLWFGAREGTLVFGLPGNPAASFVGFEVLVVPALRARLGLPFAPRAFVPAVYRGAWGGPKDRRRFRPARLRSADDGRVEVEAAPWRGSGDPFGFATADAMLELREGADPSASGPTIVRVLPLGSAA